MTTKIDTYDTNKTYVHEGNEVVLTGRTANKTKRSGKIEILYEIDLKNKPFCVSSKTKWVKLEDLFEVQNVI